MKWFSSASREAVRMMLQPLVPNESRGVTILAYHLIGADTPSPVDLPIDVFRSQMCELADVARVVSLTDALSHLETGADSAQPVVVITFDDGFDNFRTRAWPVLGRLGLPCTLYVPVAFLEGTAGAPLRGAEGLPPMSLEALRDLSVDSRLTIGSHSRCHGDLRALTPAELAEDLKHSRYRLEDVTGQPVDHFCYPRGKWSGAVETQVGAIYRTAVIAGGRKNVAERFHPLRLGRTPVRVDMPTRLSAVVQSAVWLEEWAASRARSLS